MRSLEKEARLRRVQEGGPAPKWDTREAEGMAASATSAALFGGGLGFLTQVYSNAVRQLPVLRSKTPSHRDARRGTHPKRKRAPRAAAAVRSAIPHTPAKGGSEEKPSASPVRWRDQR